MPAIKAFRASAWTLFVMGLAHLIVHFTTRSRLLDPGDNKARDLARGMQDFVVEDFPVSRNILNLHEGYSLTLAALSMLIAAVVLITITALKDNTAGLRKLARIYLAGMLVMTIISVNYFIWPPTVFLLVCFGLAAFAVAGLRKA